MCDRIIARLPYAYLVPVKGYDYKHLTEAEAVSLEDVAPFERHEKAPFPIVAADVTAPPRSTLPSFSKCLAEWRQFRGPVGSWARYFHLESLRGVRLYFTENCAMGIWPMFRLLFDQRRYIFLIGTRDQGALMADGLIHVEI